MSGGGKFDRSLTDLMASVSVVFLLMAVIFIRQATETSERATERMVSIDSRKENVRASLVDLRYRLDALNRALDGGFIRLGALDAGTALEIEFDRRHFDPGECRTPGEFSMLLRANALPLVREICLAVDAIRDAGAEPTIILEGHTDDVPFKSPKAECGVRNPDPRLGFENNVRLSAARAQEVFFTIRHELADAGAERRCLDENFVVSGRGQAAPVVRDDPSADENRRLVIRVRGDLKL